jgi:hypothetical protein
MTDPTFVDFATSPLDREDSWTFGPQKEGSQKGQSIIKISL